jgi:plasmid stabilization system protein ParE
VAVDYSYNALVDLETIEDYIAQRSGYPDVARTFIERLTDALELLGDFPDMGKRRDDVGQGIRQYTYKRLLA